MSEPLTAIPVDIETTGFETTDIITTIGFSLPLGCRVFVNPRDKIVNKHPLEDKLSTVFNTSIDLTSHTSEAEMLRAVSRFGSDTLGPREYFLVAYNGERFRGGFDLPFLRTRYADKSITWPFSNTPYADLLPIFESRFNTTSSGSDVSDLESVYKILVGDDLTELDPFQDSSEAVAAYENGDHRLLLEHNIADILRTKALVCLAEQYCSKSEFKMKSLTPVSEI